MVSYPSAVKKNKKIDFTDKIGIIINNDKSGKTMPQSSYFAKNQD